MILLSQRAVLRLSGKDAPKLLQGLITNDIYLVKEDRSIYTAWLNPNGKYWFDFFVIPDLLCEAHSADNSADHKYFGGFIIDIAAAQSEDFQTKLKFYKLRNEVEISVVEDYCVWWSASPQLLGNAGFLHNRQTHKIDEHVIAFADPRLEEMGWRFIAPRSYGKFSSMSATSRDYERHRYECGVAEFAEFVPERSLALEYNLDDLNAISWTKGCYMGQELNAISNYRSKIIKRVFPFRVEVNRVEVDRPQIQNPNDQQGDESATSAIGFSQGKFDSLYDPLYDPLSNSLAVGSRITNEDNEEVGKVIGLLHNNLKTFRQTSSSNAMDSFEDNFVELGLGLIKIDSVERCIKNSIALRCGPFLIRPYNKLISHW